jgi:hypothetical protein
VEHTPYYKMIQKDNNMIRSEVLHDDEIPLDDDLTDE